MSTLSEARRTGQLVRVRRDSIDPPDVYDAGYVLEISDALVLMQLVSDRLDLDGFDIVRTADITAWDLDFPRRTVYQRALTAKGCTPGNPGRLELSSMRALLQSVQERYPLVVVHRERVAPDECEVGRVRLSTDATYALKWVSPDGQWEDDERHYQYGDITRVQFGNEYEQTLALIAGLRPA